MMIATADYFINISTIRSPFHVASFYTLQSRLETKKSACSVRHGHSIFLPTVYSCKVGQTGWFFFVGKMGLLKILSLFAFHPRKRKRCCEVNTNKWKKQFWKSGLQAVKNWKGMLWWWHKDAVRAMCPKGRAVRRGNESQVLASVMFTAYEWCRGPLTPG